MERNPPLDGTELRGDPSLSAWTVAPPTSSQNTPLGGSTGKPAGAIVKQIHHCGKCTKTFMSIWGLKKHMQKIHVKRFTYVCPHCERGFVEKAQFQAHVHKHLGVRPYKCAACTKSFGCERNLQKHSKRCKRLVN